MLIKALVEHYLAKAILGKIFDDKSTLFHVNSLSRERVKIWFFFHGSYNQHKV